MSKRTSVQDPILPNATYIGFTGTPIDRLTRGRGTFKVFGTDDENG